MKKEEEMVPPHKVVFQLYYVVTVFRVSPEIIGLMNGWMTEWMNKQCRNKWITKWMNE